MSLKVQRVAGTIASFALLLAMPANLAAQQSNVVGSPV